MPKFIPAVLGELEPRKVYPMTEDELQVLKKGSSSSLYLNLAIALISLAIGSYRFFVTFGENNNCTIIPTGEKFNFATLIT